MQNSDTEADVETQKILPLLTGDGLLEIPLEQIKSKNTVAPKTIGKGSHQKVGYIPDFCVYKESIPILVVEAKRSKVQVGGAYSEARLYAAEINSGFRHGVNPCCRIFASNGDEFLAGYWDADAALAGKHADLLAGTKLLHDLRALCGNTALDLLAKKFSGDLRSNKFKRPFNQGAGVAQIQSRIEPNSFSADLAPVIRRYFSSHEQELDEDIFSKAYISSNEVTGYDRILESYLKDRLAKSKNLTQIKTTKNKSAELTEAINSYSQRRSVSGQMQLVTGGVGAGKSLFARRYKEFLQPAQLKNRNHWSFLNFNNAPDDPKQWQDWVCETFVASLREEGSSVDASDEETQESIFAPDLAEKKAYYDRMERAQPGRRDLEMARDIEAWRQDSKKLTTSIARYIQGDRGENLIVVFDNVDRRESSAQLAAFQTALWFMSQTRAMVILQLRDSTFEAFKDEPPLDTYKTGKIFHISPPRFVDVVKRRLELSMSEFSNAPSEMVSFQTSKGLTVSYPKSRAAEFLRGVYLELFQYSKNSARILEALAGKNVRRALDMFMALITSGHMPEETILSVAQGHGVGRIPDYRILRAIMRQDYRFFNESSGFISNIFYCPAFGIKPPA